ncbi:hypothetical protein AB1L42_23000, partial [Thalassoglobus sp. JC818]|uniref:hypothetical protein n=1 Tax=Thalassoglobus sp. JC818 TaxID=3232136 RepID=UPI0034580558
MASFIYDKDTREAGIQFYERNRRRRSTQLSNVNRGFAERFHTAIEKLNEIRITGGVDRFSGEFVRDLGDVFHEKLVKVDLVQPKQAKTEETVDIPSDVK